MCSDPFWGVRKSCAEVIHPLAQVCSKESRWNILSPCLIQLLQDQSRWVKTAALRVLGYFISTFARSDQDEEQEQQQQQQQQDGQDNKQSDSNDQQIDNLSSNLEQNIKLDENEKFNDFNYWREPISMDIDLDQDVLFSSNQRLFFLFEFFFRK